MAQKKEFNMQTIENNIKKFFSWVEKTWVRRTGFVLGCTWLYFVFVTLGACTGWRCDEELVAVWSSIGVFAYIIGLIWICKKTSKHQPDNKPVHWMNLFIRRILWSFGYLIVVGIGVGLMIAINDGNWCDTAAVFAIFALSPMAIMWWIVGLFIKQNLIMEANIKALEMHSGKKRSVVYDD